MLEARAVPVEHGEIGVKIEALETRVPRSAGEHPRGVRRFLGHGILRRDVGIAVEAPAPEKAPHPCRDRREHDADRFVRRGRCRLEAKVTWREAAEVPAGGRALPRKTSRGAVRLQARLYAMLRDDLRLIAAAQ